MKMKKRTQLNKPLKMFIIKLALSSLALILVLTSCIYITLAWYTKMVSVAGLEFKTAEWDFTANYAVSDIYIDVYQYSTITDTPDRLAAPGTKGYIPIKLGAYQSDTDIEFSLLIDRLSMSENFQKRIFFYYCTDASGKISSVETDNRVYLHGSPTDPIPTTSNQVPLDGTIKRQSNTDVMVFWEWVYEGGTTDTEKEAWDEFDTSVGKNPALYLDEMHAKVMIYGVEILPENPVMPSQGA